MIDKPELKVREYEVYTGYYCGVCKSIGRRYGQLPRMALSYDAAFLAIMLASLDDTPDAPVQEHCIGHRIKKKTIIRNAAIDYAADVMLILAWYKLLDDAEDEGKFYAIAAATALKRVYGKLQRKHPALCSGIETHLAELSALEKAKCDSLDMAAEAFSRIMEVIFAEGARLLYGDAAKGEKPTEPHTDTRQATAEIADPPADTEDAFARIGYHLGKWVYLIDAVDDIEDNLETGAYNPLFYRFRYDKDSETPEGFRTRIDETLRFNLFHYLAVISQHTNSLDIKKNQGIIDNVIYFGLNRKTEEILKRENTQKKI